jgi:hypothetical protein
VTDCLRASSTLTHVFSWLTVTAETADGEAVLSFLLSPGARAADTCRTNSMMKAPLWYDVLESQEAVITVCLAKARMNVHAAEPVIRYQAHVGFAKTLEPAYYAVIFASQRTQGDRGYER